MPSYSWSTIARDVTPGETLPVGVSRQTIPGNQAVLCLHEALPASLSHPPVTTPNNSLLPRKGRYGLPAES
jgi:hypothetical protein